MSEAKLTQTGPLWLWTASNGVGWHFITIDGAAGETIAANEAMRRLELGRKRGFRSQKVEAQIGETLWSTSCFPSDDGAWLLPVKAPVRKAEGLAEGDEVRVTLTLL